MRFLLCLSIMCCFSATRAYAVCVTLNFANIGTSQNFSGATAGYDTFDSSTYSQAVSFQVQSLATVATCSYFVAMRTGQSGDANNRYLSLGANKLPYNVYTDSNSTNILLPANVANASNIITGSFPVLVGITQSQSKSLYWKIPSQTIVPASATNYTDPGVVMELWEGTLGALPVLRDSVALNFQAKVNTKVDLSIVNTGSAFNMANNSRAVDFGTAISGDTRSFDFSIRSNMGYSLTLQSTNGQKLTQSGISSSIPYTIAVNGTNQNLSAGSIVPVASQSGITTPLTGTNIPVKITLGTLTGTETAGVYQDNLSVVVSAN